MLWRDRGAGAKGEVMSAFVQGAGGIIGHFRVPACLNFKTSLRAKPLK